MSDSEFDPRAFCWYAMAFMDGDHSDRILANAMLSQSLKEKYDRGLKHFWCSAISLLLARYGSKIDAAIKDQILERLAFKLKAESKQRFRGYNDNFPAMAAFSMMVGGKLTDQDYDQVGLECLQSLKCLLSRRGLLSEHTSPTYTPITLTCLAGIAEFCDLEEAKSLAQTAEYRVWLDLCARYFPPTSSLSGPHSRAYAADLCGHFLKAHVCFYMVLGEYAHINPLNTAYLPADGRVLHQGRADFVQKSIPWQASVTYHIPEDAVRLALCKPDRFEIFADTEQSAFPRNVWEPVRHPNDPLGEFAAGEINTYTYITRDYALGHSDRTFLDGFQHSPLHLTYSRASGFSTIHDVATLFPRFVIGDRMPDPLEHHLYDDGRTLCVGRGGTAMVLYRGRPSWGAATDWPDWNQTPVAKIRLDILLTCFQKRPDEIWLGPEQLDGWKGESKDPVGIFLSDHGLYIAIHPLNRTDYGRSAAIRVGQHKGFGMFSLMNYEGTPRKFNDGEIATCMNGFVIEVFSVREQSSVMSFRQFRERYSHVEITDEYAPADGMRRVCYRREGMKLEMSVSPISDGIKYRCVNDHRFPNHSFHVAGMKLSPIPWLDDEETST